MAWKKPTPWHKRYHEDALNGYMNLSLEERGAYTTLLDLLYRDGEPLPDNEHFLAGWMQVSIRKYRALRDRLIEVGKLMRTPDGKLTNRRFEDERKKADSIAESRVESAKIGGKKSAENKKKAKENSEAVKQTVKQNPTNARASLRDSEITELNTDTSRPTIPRDDEQVTSIWKFRSDLEAQVDKAVGRFFKQPIILEQLVVSQGVSIELDVIPVVMDVIRFKADDPPSSWAYFEKPILQAFKKRTSKNGFHPSGAANSVVEDRERWEARLKHARSHKQWHIGAWGPMPHDNGCRAPPELLQPDDGRDWQEWYFNEIKDRWETKPKQSRNS